MTREEEIAIEWDVQKVMSEFYHYVDQGDFENAANLYVEDANWESMSHKLKGRDNILKALHGGLTDGTIRHVQTNTVVTVIDNDHAEARWYSTVYYSDEGRIENSDGPLPFKGPHRVQDFHTAAMRTPDGWRFTSRKSQLIFRRPDEDPIPFETWAENKPT